MVANKYCQGVAMNILYVVSSDVHQCKSGTEQRTNFLYKALCELGTVYVAQVGEKRRQINGYHWELPITKQKGLKRLFTLFESLIVRLICPDCKLRYYLFPYYLEIREVFPNVKFDKVVVRYLNNVGIFHLWEYGSLFVDIDDHPVQLYETMVSCRLNPIWAYIGKRVQVFFTKLCLSRVDGAWIANPTQYSLIAEVCKAAVLPNIPMRFDISQYAGTGEQGQYIFTVGFMNYRPNYEGVNTFLKKIWPKVHSQYPTLEYKVAGKGLPEQYVQKWSGIPGVKVLGFVDDIRAVYANAMATVVPIESGSGTCIKTLESISNGRICFSTPFGARGIEIGGESLSECGLFIYNTADEFLLCLSKLFDHPAWKQEIERYGRNKVRRVYSNDAFMDSVRNVLI